MPHSYDREKLGRIRQRAEVLLARHLPGWGFAFNRQRRTLGLCRYRERRIELSRPHATAGSLGQAEATLLHEIAHALAGPGTGHGPAWRRIMRQLGQTPEVTARPEYQLNDFKWALVRRDSADNLHFIAGRYRRPRHCAHWALRGQPDTLGTVFYCLYTDYQSYQAGALTAPEITLHQ